MHRFLAEWRQELDNKTPSYEELYFLLDQIGKHLAGEVEGICISRLVKNYITDIYSRAPVDSGDVDSLSHFDVNTEACNVISDLTRIMLSGHTEESNT
jgi:hypothetical protein